MGRSRGGSIHGNVGNLFTLVIASSAAGMSIQDGFTIDKEPIMVIAMVQRKFQKPDAIGPAFHGMGHGIPVVEITRQMNLAGIRSLTHKADKG
jgi:hypothetical protein